MTSISTTGRGLPPACSRRRLPAAVVSEGGTAGVEHYVGTSFSPPVAVRADGQR